MKAVGFSRYLPIAEPESFIDLQIEQPSATGHDVMVAVRAIAVNPVDTKVRRSKDEVEDPPRVIGYDTSGVVEAVGEDVSLFKVGDEVFYAGDITRSGSNAEYHLIDERIVGKKPSSLSFAESAALPLTAITAYESFFDRLKIDLEGGNKGESLLIIGAGGGVGSIGIQLAKLAGLTVIATASRRESAQWVTGLGADFVINHKHDMVEQLHATGFEYVDHIAIFNDMSHWNACVELIRPQGGIVTIDNTDTDMPMAAMKTKCASLHWEFMFARSMFKTPDMIKQHELLNFIAESIDKGVIKTTVNEVLSPINATNLKRAHTLIERGDAIGKVVLEGWG